MVASSVQLNAGKVGLCGTTTGVPPIPTAAPNCNLVHRTWNKMVDDHMLAKGVMLSVSPFSVRTDLA